MNYHGFRQGRYKRVRMRAEELTNAIVGTETTGPIIEETSFLA
jgi:hypothetical protein